MLKTVNKSRYRNNNNMILNKIILKMAISINKFLSNKTLL